MATFIQSEPSTNGTPHPTDAGSLIRTNQWGIDNTLSGWIIQSEDIQQEAITDTTQDQKGAVVSQLDYDYHYTLTLNLIGGTGGAGDGTEDSSLPDIGSTDFSYAGHTWKVNGVTYNGQYASKKSYTITAERWTNFPS